MPPIIGRLVLRSSSLCRQQVNSARINTSLCGPKGAHRLGDRVRENATWINPPKVSPSINDSWRRLAHSKSSLVAQKRKTVQVRVTTLPDKYKMEWPKITLFGDSITRRSLDPDNGCWAGHIAYRVGSFFDVDTRGFEGYNTKWAYEMMPRLFPKSYLDKVSLFVIFFGHNDSWDEKVPMHVPVTDFEANLRKIIKYLEDQGLARHQVILITPTWYYHPDCEKMCHDQGFPVIGKTAEDAKKYADAVSRVGAELEVNVVDFFTTSFKKEPLQEMFCDGVHLSRLGAKMLADQLMPVIEKKIEQSYGKALADLWHELPLDQRPEVMPILSLLRSHAASSDSPNE